MESEKLKSIDETRRGMVGDYTTLVLIGSRERKLKIHLKDSCDVTVR